MPLDAKPGSTIVICATPPGSGNVGEIILRDLILHFGVDSVHCVAVTEPGYTWKPDGSMDKLDLIRLESRFIRAARRGSGKLGALLSYIRFRAGFYREVRKVTAAIATRYRATTAKQVFAVLDNPVAMAVARRVSGALGLPLVSLVWDPPEYVLSALGHDRWSRALLLGEFKSSLSASQRLAVVSESMLVDYARETAATITILRHGLPLPSAEDDAKIALGESEWVIGFAGSMYSDCAWRAFLSALDSVKWRIAGRPVRLKLLARKMTVVAQNPANIEFLGFRSVEQVQEALSSCHITYMPQPFVSHLRELCRYSFPTKLTNYLAVGRPVFVHAPPYGALSVFFEANPIGALANSLEPEAIVSALTALLGSAEAYRQATKQVAVSASAHFDASAFNRALDALLA